jgi:RND family efflux transporter MFP subunit
MDKQPARRTVPALRWSSSSRLACLAAALLLVAAFVGCEGESGPAPSKPPEVDVSHPEASTVADFEVFTGRTQSPHYIDIKASHVTGYLEQVNFQEGDDVKAGQILFTIDSKTYDAALAQAVAQCDLATSHLQTMRDVYKRDLASPAATPEAALIQDRDNALEAEASLKAAQATHQAAQNNVDYCVIRAPFDGRISRRLVDPGNDVTADVTVLASLVQLDPLYAYFDVDERTLLRIGALLPEGKIPPDAAQNFPLTLGLANEKPEEFKHKGTLKIADNKVDPGTGTLRMWGMFDNAKHDLKPGLFVRVRMDVGKPRLDFLFVAEAALGSDQGRKYVYVVNDENKAVYTQVEVGPRQNGLIAVKPTPPPPGLSSAEAASKGYTLTKDDRVVVNGLQRIHPVVDAEGHQHPMEVQPTLKDMPRATTPTTQTPIAADQGSGPGKK